MFLIQLTASRISHLLKPIDPGTFARRKVVREHWFNLCSHGDLKFKKCLIEGQTHADKAGGEHVRSNKEGKETKAHKANKM